MEHLSSRLRRIIKSSRKLQSSGQAYAADIREFSQHVGSFLEKETDVPDDDVYKKAVGRFSAVLQDSEQLLQMQASKLDLVFTIPLDAMLRNHIASLKEQFKKHEKVKASYDACLHRWSHLKAKDVAKIEECRTDLANLSRQYNQVTLELATAINKFEAHKTITVLDRFAQMIFNQALFFRHGNQLFSDMDPFLSDVMGHIQQFKTQFTQAEQHPHRADDASSGNLAGGSASGKDLSSALTTIEGYLFKKGKNVVQPWQRRYFSISNGFFIAYKTGGDRKEVRPVPVINLLLCTVKMVPDPDRRFCFELVSPTCSYQLQAQSQEELMTWITVIQNAIQSALDQGHSAKGTSITAGTSASPREFAARVSAFTPSCATCADCREANPVWASINLGITICIECSGIHRSLGVHISKVRSLTLDDWADPVLGVLMTVGNERSNEVYEARYGQPDLPADAPVKPSPKSDRPLR
ncbi:MAG: hypothetical protein Q8P67_17710, partial [archaeon]|nr:hypothetical protein [archaeon]